jgi:ATP phosphoribosyltransferase
MRQCSTSTPLDRPARGNTKALPGLSPTTLPEEHPMTIRIAVPNKGRLEASATTLLKTSGIRFEKGERALSVPARNANIEILFVRADDIPQLVASDVADVGITGIDLVTESGADVTLAGELGFGSCTLTAAVPTRSGITSVDEFAGKRIATAHPNATAAYFADQGVEVTVVPLRGAVEVAPKLGIADVIVDLVSSGSTMLTNGLRPIATILESQAVAITRPDATDDPEIQRLITMMMSVVAAKAMRYVLMNAPGDSVEDIAALIPGLDAPSVVPLSGETADVAIHSVVRADRLWDALPLLKEAGASGILVLPIEQFIA